jgi:MerR family redox-sensitive transcriptional activator SoxR
VRIGELSSLTGASTRALRYYEEQGLIRSERLANGYRDYGQRTVETVRFIQDLLAAGLSSKVLRDIMPCLSDGHDEPRCADTVVQVRRVRDGLLDQEQRIRAQREKLEQYLSGDLVVAVTAPNAVDA